MELQNSSETVEPSMAAPRVSWVSRFESRMHKLPLGRQTLGCLQWVVVAALVASGFYGAEAINNGVELAMKSDGSASQPILVVAAPPTARD